MTNLYYVSAAAFFLATIGCTSLALAIYRRANRNAEVRVLLLMLLLFSLQSFVLFFDALSYGVLKVLQEQTYEIIAAAGLGLQLLLFASVAHFLVITHRRVLTESGELADPLSPYRGFDKQWLYLLNISWPYLMALTVTGKNLYSILRSLQANPEGQLVPAAKLYDNFQAVFFCFFLLVFLVPQVMLNAYREKADSRLSRFVGRMTRPLFRHLPQPESILRLSDGPSNPIPCRRPIWPERSRLWVSPRLRYSANSPISISKISISKDEWRALQVILIWLFTAVIVALWNHLEFKLNQLSGITWFLLPAVFMAALIYYKMRFVFSDVLIKRGVIAGIFFILSALSYGLVLSPIHRFVARKNEAAGPLTLYVGSVLFLACWLGIYRRLNELLDRHLFRRSDYAKLVSEIGNDMKQFAEPETLLATVPERLRIAVNAETVRFVPSDSSETEAASMLVPPVETTQRQLATALIPVATVDKIYGHLEFGKRHGGFRYQSEDLTFMTSVARQLAGMLHNFELRAEREAQQQREQRLRELAAQSELRALRAQINPHFLFNALNSLADLTQEDPKAAEAAILNLSHVFRYALEASRSETVTLGEELDFLRAYLSVECLRFEDRMRYEIDASPEARDCRIPPMLIQPLVENAVRHGISGKIDGGFIEITAGVEDGRLHIEVEDNGAGFDPEARHDQDARGIGLNNVRSRLEHLSGPGALQIKSIPGRGTSMSFNMPATLEPGRKGLAQ